MNENTLNCISMQLIKYKDFLWIVPSPPLVQCHGAKKKKNSVLQGVGVGHPRGLGQRGEGTTLFDQKMRKETNTKIKKIS